jgi:hypothetical protein
VPKLAASQGPSRNTQIGTLSVDVTIENQANNNLGVPPASPVHEVRLGRRTSDRSPAPVQHFDQPDDLTRSELDPVTTQLEVASGGQRCDQPH